MASVVTRGTLGAALAVLLGIATGCGPSRPQRVPVSYEVTGWEFGGAPGQKLTTPHYDVYTTVTDPVLVKAFPELLERAFAFYQELVPLDREPEQRMQVYLFATREQWAYFTRRLTGPRAEVFLRIRNGGYSEGGISVIQYVAHQVTFPLLAHEGLHQYLHHCVRTDVPAWLNEGLAVTCEGQRWTGDGLDAFDRWYNPARKNQLAEALLRKRLFPLQELLATHAGKVVHETSSRVATYYAQVWALTLFLTEGEDGKYAERFDQLRHALSSPELDQRLATEQVFVEGGRRLSRGEALFRSYISDDVAAVEREYLAFMRERILGSD
ncbi:MAG: hypothetical protein PVJ57_19595 [Phycisphaerae bacterium]|jgi:hypothetical protein